MEYQTAVVLSICSNIVVMLRYHYVELSWFGYDLETTCYFKICIHENRFSKDSLTLMALTENYILTPFFLMFSGYTDFDQVETA
jgi:hypothetical protein